jgi:hypothetical protein
MLTSSSSAFNFVVRQWINYVDAGNAAAIARR